MTPMTRTTATATTAVVVAPMGFIQDLHIILSLKMVHQASATATCSVMQSSLCSFAWPVRTPSTLDAGRTDAGHMAELEWHPAGPSRPPLPPSPPCPLRLCSVCSWLHLLLALSPPRSASFSLYLLLTLTPVGSVSSWLCLPLALSPPGSVRRVSKG